MTLRLLWPEQVPFFQEPFFDRFDRLLKTAAAIEGWAREKPILRDRDYGVFWSVLWQLQVMERLLELGAQLRWNGSGPDLTATIAGQTLHVECMVVRGRQPQHEYVDDILKFVDPTLRLSSARFPNHASTLDLTFDSLVTEVEKWWGSRHDHAETDMYGIPLHEIRREGFSVRSVPLDGPHPIFPSDSPFVRDDPEYVPREIERATSQKLGKNSISVPGPKILALNFLLDHDFQLNLYLQRGRGLQLPASIAPEYDSVLVSTCGIDRPLRGSHSWFVRSGATIPQSVLASLGD